MSDELSIQPHQASTSLDEPPKSASESIEEWLENFWERLRAKAASVDAKGAAEVGVVLIVYLTWIALMVGWALHGYLS